MMTHVARRYAALLGIAALALGAASLPVGAQSSRDQLHVSLTLSGHVFLGVGYTHWADQNNALEATVFPVITPGNGFPFAVRVGYGWVPSQERWRAKLGADLILLLSPPGPRDRSFLLLPTFSPGIRYATDEGNLLGGDLWMSYFLHRNVFAPTGLELRYGRGF